MPELFYSTGQTASLLGVTPHTIRRLCAAGLIKGEPTEGGHYRIPATEIQRLKKDGIPPLPRFTENTETGNHALGMTRSVTIRPASAPPAAPDAVRTSSDAVAIAENTLKRRKIELDLQAVENQFEEHEARRRTRENEQRRILERNRAAEDAARKRNEWEAKWFQYANDRLPRNAPPDLRLELPDLIAEVLQKMTAEQSENVMRSLLDAAILKCLAPWLRRQQNEKIVQEAVGTLPYWARSYVRPTIWQVRAAEAARAAIEEVSVQTTDEELQTLARHAVKQIGAEFEHEERCQQVISEVWLRGAGQEGQEKAKRLVHAALQNLPLGASLNEMEKLRESILKTLLAEAAQH